MNKYVLTFMLLLGSSTSAMATCNTIMTPSTPDSRFIIATDGTVTDKFTGLMWKRCLEGQTWDGSICSGSAATYTWQNALGRAAAVNAGTEGEQLEHTDWRVPNVKEVASIIERACYSPAANTTVFLSLTSGNLWTSSPSAFNSAQAWQVTISDGRAGSVAKSSAYSLLLVRDTMSPPL